MNRRHQDEPVPESVRHGIRKASHGHDLTRDESRSVFDDVMAGNVPHAAVAGLVCALATKKECVDELVGAAEALRAAATRVRYDGPCLDTCGTGGDGISTFNVSTTAAAIAAAAGVVVAKHGNRTSSRVSGSSEVLEVLGVRLDVGTDVLERCLREQGLAFLHAPHLHPAMKHAAVVRRAVRRRTIFNLVGPLANPASATHHLLGVSRVEHLELMARALGQLGVKRAWVTHGADGLCDLSITGPTRIVELDHDQIRSFTVTPDDAGLARAPLSSLLVESPRASASVIEAILEGQLGPARDHALLNAAAALVVYGLTESLSESVRIVATALDSGEARQRLAHVAAITSGRA